MTVVLKTPWAGHPAGATLTLSDYDEVALVRAVAAVFAGGVVRGGPLPLVGERGPEVLTPPVTKPARSGRKKA